MMTIGKDPEEILIVEDSLTQAESLKFVLERHGYRVSTARNGREAVSWLARHKPHMIISDVMMPEMDGFQLCRFVRGDENLKSLPLILLTALSDPADVLKALECGADNFIIKPFDEHTLPRRIELFMLHRDLHKREGVQVGLEIVFQGQKYFINSDRLQILNILLSTYEAAVDQNAELRWTKSELETHIAELEAQGQELQVQNYELGELTEELLATEKGTQRQAQILAGINRIFREGITCETEEELGRTCLAAAEELTGSWFGFIGEINRDGLMDDLAISDPGWELCRVPGTTEPVTPKGLHIRGFFATTIKDERSIIINDPAAHPDRVGIPAGHPPLTAFLGVPLKQGGKTIGMIGLANKPGGYDTGDQAAAEALAPAIVEALLRKRAEARIKELNKDLLHHVRQLEAANKELEAFSYSVSHDLRAPLRGIAGFARILEDQYRDKLDDQGLQYLQTLQRASDQMNELINALLGLARLSRAEMRQANVDLSALARSIAQNLQSSDPPRQVEFVITDGLTTIGDPNLVKIMIENLLANAWKFTSRTPQARIAFGVQDSGGDRVFFIRDNGVGFNMKYAGKLFGAFQRLHGASEFPGTGIGLATVQRIINRLGGRIWAEGAVNQGATFYFTLEPKL